LPAIAPSDGGSRSTQGRGLEFFTQHDQFAFGDGCDRPSYVTADFPHSKVAVNLLALKIFSCGTPTAINLARLGGVRLHFSSRGTFPACAKNHHRPEGIYTYHYAGAAGLLRQINLPGGSLRTNYFGFSGELLHNYLKGPAGAILDEHGYGYDLSLSFCG